MKATPILDLSRLDRLRDQYETAKAATGRAHEAALDAHNKASACRADRSALQNNVEQNLLVMDTRDYRASRRKLEELEQEQVREKTALFEKHAALSEKSKALGQLLHNCVEFAKGHSNDR